MDAKRFDAIAKALISETDRRRTLGGILVSALGLAGAKDAEAAKSGECKKDCDPLCEFCKEGKCRKNKRGKRVCKKGKCKPLTDGTACSSPANGATCQKGACTCPGGLTVCSGVCKDLKTDKVNCGTCGTVCPANQVCLNGACGCPAGQELCNGICVSRCAPNAQARNQNNCTCCFVNNLPCNNASNPRIPQADPTCCSNVCLPVGGPGSTSGICSAGGPGTPCNVDANCTTNNCENGECAN